INYRATFLTVSHVRVVSWSPNVFSTSVMNNAPRGLGTLALKTSVPFMQKDSSAIHLDLAETASTRFHRALDTWSNEGSSGLPARIVDQHRDLAGAKVGRSSADVPSVTC